MSYRLVAIAFVFCATACTLSPLADPAFVRAAPLPGEASPRQEAKPVDAVPPKPPTRS